MAIKAAGFILASVTQGSNDAFAETTIPTGLSLIGNLAYQLRCVHWQTSAMLAVDATNIIVGLTRRTKSASSSWTDPDCIWLYRRDVELATSGAFTAESVGTYVFPGPTYVVEDNLFLNIDSAGTSATNTALIRIEYDIVRVTDAERSALLARTVLSTVSS